MFLTLAADGRHCAPCHQPDGPAPFSLITFDDVVTFADNIGKQTEVFNGVDFAANARLRSDLFVTGGVGRR